MLLTVQIILSARLKLFTTTVNAIPKPGLFIPSRDGIKQFFKTGTFLASGKFNVKPWNVTQEKRTKLSDRIRFGSSFEWLIN